MAYRLRNRKLQTALDGISDGDFSRRLQEEVESRKKDVFRDENGRQKTLGWDENEDRLFVTFGRRVPISAQERRLAAVFEPGDIVYEEMPGGEENAFS